MLFKKSNLHLVSLFLCFLLTMAINQNVVAMNTEGTKQIASTVVNPESKLSQWEQSEINSANAIGIVPAELKNDYSGEVTEKELYSLLSNCINLYSGKIDDAWADLVKNASKSQTVRRKEAAKLIYKAATEGLGIQKANGTPYVNGFGKWFMDDIEKIGDAYWAMEFVNGQFDYTSNARVMETTSDFYFRVDDNMTRVEAISAVYRLFNSILPSPVYVPFNKVERLSFSKDELNKAKLMPEATVKKLPEWRGLNLINKMKNFTFYTNTVMFAEQDVKNISEWGFNFIRVPLNYYTICKSGDEPTVDMVHLTNIDNLVKWGIKYKVHICFDAHTLPGYGASVDLNNTKPDFFDNEQKQNLAAEFFSMLARRYADLPNNALSFNLLNEPQNTTKEAYIKAVVKLSSAIRTVTPDRLLFADGWLDKDWHVAAVPLKEIADMGIVQSMHYYHPDFFTFALFNNGGYALQSWPFPYVNGWIWGTKENKENLNVKGSLSAGSEVSVRINSANGNGDFVIKANGKELLRKSLRNPKVGENGCISMFDKDTANYNLVYTVRLPEATQNLELLWDGGWWMRVSNIRVKHPELTNVETPYFGSASEGFKLKHKSNNVITNILCSNGEYDVPASTVVVDSKGKYDNPKQKNLEWNIDRMREFVAKWTEFSKQNNTAIMCQEFGVWNTVSHDATLDWMSDWMKVLNENDIPWAAWGYRDYMGLLNTNRYDVKYENYGPYFLDRKMLELLQKYQ